MLNNEILDLATAIFSWVTDKPTVCVCGGGSHVICALKEKKNSPYVTQTSKGHTQRGLNVCISKRYF